MPSVLAYHRPTSLDEAAKLLSGAHRRALAGGTAAVPTARKVSSTGVEMVDLQELGLSKIVPSGDGLELGAMVRLSDLREHDQVPDLIKEAARRELPSALRNQATIGGTVGQADSDSTLLAALLVHDARIELHGQPNVTLGDYLSGDRGGLIIAVTIDPTGAGSLSSTGRTPADTPIVAALARSTSNGPRLALTGVAATPIEVDATAPTSALDPSGDFRGTAAYRTHLATVHSARALAKVN